MFKHSTRIYVHHTDVTGRLFYAVQFYLVHEAKEHFLESIGFSLKTQLDDPQVTFPLVHAEADYKAMLKAGDQVDIAVKIEKIGETSVVFAFDILKGSQLVGTAKTVSVAVDKHTGRKMPIPLKWRKQLEKGL